ncbi:hypothetical protein D8796_01210 [Streptococcus cristatus]|uniref:Uncharacterized protein n=1 Tax=Streptococcus cristatus TaxID=45634 RepID=A0A428GWJ1_STRCR|nr:hypothetical protein [Streptococcus cristatus]RSJ80949.1 hypothetical protein D8795_03110 [Streptococcus cristatus]RSJ82349.1 hypothetical protein D8796_01210 [Streptococcus cristatus]RSJ87518.1 hypothetical protein D8793_01155 [Streptococcus cristatus]RSJ87984.1 hypothetical protein D8794_01155 [Streptococcus cristatus]
MKDRNLEALRREHKSKFKARNTSSVKNQRERGGAALEQTKEEARKEKLGENQFGVKTGWKSSRLRTRKKGNVKSLVATLASLVLLSLALLLLYRFLSNMGTHDRSIDQISWESSQENIASAYVADSSSEWEASEPQESASSASSADKGPENMTWTFEDVLALQVSSPVQGASEQLSPTAEEIVERYGKASSGSVAKDGEEKALYLFYLSSGGGQIVKFYFNLIGDQYWLNTIRGEGLLSQSQSTHSDLWTEEDFQDFTVDKSAPSKNLQAVLERFGVPQVINKSADYKNQTTVYIKYKLKDGRYLYLEFVLSPTGDYELTRKSIY